MNSLWDIRIFLGLVPKESPCICGYLKSVLKHKFLILDTYFAALCIYVSKNDMRIRGYLKKRGGGPLATILGDAAVVYH